MPSPSEREILILLPVNRLGGAELTMLAIAEGLLRRGRSVKLAIYGPGKDLLMQHATDVKILKLPTSTTSATMRLLYPLLRQKKNVVLITALTHTNLMAILTARAVGGNVSVIVTEHAPPRKFALTHFGWKHKGLRPMIGLVYPWADAIVAVSQGVAQDIKELLVVKKPVHVIHNPIVSALPKNVLPLEDEPWLDRTLSPIVMGIGRLSPEKDFALLIRAFAKVASRRPVRLVILGDGSQREELEALVESLGITDRVLFPGFVKNVTRWLKKADLFVCSSRFEGFGNAIVEAMASRIPVVSTDCPVGPSEILENGRYGRLVPVGDVDAMAEAIEETLRQPYPIDESERRANDFTETRCIDRFLELIDSLGEKGHAASDGMPVP